MTDSSSFSKSYNPDVLCCLANLSSDEVFTPPDIANAMLDLLPQELFQNPDTKFLDPCCKSGVFLREIAKRLIKGLEPVFPDLQERLNHIFKKQLYGIAPTTLTSLISRRSLYCSKDADSEYSVVHFDSPEGNIRFSNTRHIWKNGRCIFCGASKDVYDRECGLESHAYELIHLNKPEELFDMKFDVIIGNPPYQLNTFSETEIENKKKKQKNKQARPIYNLFVEQAKKLDPRYLCMIIPSRWFAGGMGLDDFRQSMMNDRGISRIVDYTNSKDCFPDISVSGGVCYFLRERDRSGDCEFTNITNDEKDSMVRPLNEFGTLVRFNKAVSIIHKIQSKHDAKLEEMISSLMPYGLSTSYRGKKNPPAEDALTLYSSDGISYITRSEICKGLESVDAYKILVSKTCAEHAGEPGKDGKFKVIPSSMKVLVPGEICTHSYFFVGCWKDRAQAENALSYLRTKFVRFLMLLCVSGYGLSKLVFQFVPMQDFSKPWTDEELYAKYGISAKEIAFIDSMIRPMEGDD
ncbi:MAG: Eco57I restriction-modification methylase domain-containing protein [Succinimonas sp.]|nr:Eco57I restriction-modification methylase domain-containing protein [Succinimonas sp.]